MTNPTKAEELAALLDRWEATYSLTLDHHDLYQRWACGAPAGCALALRTAVAELRRLSAVEAQRVEPLTDERLRQTHHEDEFGLYCDEDDFLEIARYVQSECARVWGVKLGDTTGKETGNV